MSTHKPNPMEFTMEPTVAVTPMGMWCDPSKYHIHKILIHRHFEIFEIGLNADFAFFVTWLYNNDIPEQDIRTHFVGLWHLASQLKSESFEGYIKRKGKECLGESDYLFLARDVNRQPDDLFDPFEPLHRYIFQGLVDKINTNGWVGFIERSMGKWEEFMNHKDDAIGTKGEFISTLMSWLDKDHD
ncbi:hypothetical protein AYL99_00293 [Fonsecaea erecta]|uniref:BTB domain-containing protein n=1 Tax=Fonsecaea erecta TaxID=1367422 RepID=A0A178ZYC0_9EURO|nr:hypothetical protein AYL99_00293 [Fonsecaea erecta]OAP64321.1 hypothetical protein AYL99_00293 [Fonsecaea erecta]